MGGILGIILTFALLCLLAFLVYKGYSVLVVSPILAMFVFLVNGYPILDGMKEAYIGGAANFFKSWYLFFLLGAVFGKLMEMSGAAASIANSIVKIFGVRMAIPAVVLSCGILMMGGISGFVVVFAVLPFALELWKQANLPRRLIVPTFGLGCSGAFMYCPGSPQMQNVIPMDVLGTSSTAGFVVGIIVTISTLTLGCLYINGEAKKAAAKGEFFHPHETDEFKNGEETLPNIFISLLPLIVVFVLFAIVNLDILVCLLIGTALSVLLYWASIKNSIKEIFITGGQGAMGAAVNTGLVVAFASAFQATSGYPLLIEKVLNLPFDPLISAAIAINVICGVTGSASGGLSVCLPDLGPAFVAQGVPAAALHRVAAVSSACCDSLPHNGWLITLLSVTHHTHKETYKDYFMVTVAIAALGVVIAIALFKLFPFLAV